MSRRSDSTMSQTVVRPLHSTLRNSYENQLMTNTSMLATVSPQHRELIQEIAKFPHTPVTLDQIVEELGADLDVVADELALMDLEGLIDVYLLPEGPAIGLSDFTVQHILDQELVTAESAVECVG